MSDRTDDLSSQTPVHYDWSLSFDHTMLRKALAYWIERSGTRPMPLKTDMSVRGTKEFIANVSLMDINLTADGSVDYSVKLIGERVRQYYGPIAHRKLSEFLPADLEQRWRAALDRVRTTKQPLRVHGRMSYANHTWLYQETLLAPLSDDAGETAMFLMVTAWSPYR
ncbi:MAG TPA: PAS domain-containing protein [Rhizomicrobium sp.]|jgi:hypothetical protein